MAKHTHGHIHTFGVGGALVTTHILKVNFSGTKRKRTMLIRAIYMHAQIFI